MTGRRSHGRLSALNGVVHQGTSPAHAQRFLHVHGVIQNLFRVGRHLLRSVHHRMLRARSFTGWAEVTAA